MDRKAQTGGTTVKKAVAFWLCAAMLCALAAPAGAEGFAASYEGRWVASRQSAVKVFLPSGWSVKSEQAAPEGIWAEDPAAGVAMRLSLSPSQFRTPDEVLAGYTLDGQYQNAEIVSLGDWTYVLMESQRDGAYVGVVDSTYFAMTFTFTFTPLGAPGLSQTAREIMSSLCENKDGNG